MICFRFPYHRSAMFIFSPENREGLKKPGRLEYNSGGYPSDEPLVLCRSSVTYHELPVDQFAMIFHIGNIFYRIGCFFSNCHMIISPYG